MAKYVLSIDISDPVLSIDESHCEAADTFVELVLRERGFNPDDISLPNAVLTDIASNWAKRLAAIEGSMGDDSLLISKAREFEKSANALVSKLNRASLGLAAPAGSAYGQITLGRG